MGEVQVFFINQVTLIYKLALSQIEGGLSEDKCGECREDRYCPEFG